MQAAASSNQMLDHSLVNDLSWYAIFTNPRQEERANSNLLSWGVETFSPRWKECRRNQFTGVPTYFTKPLFPRYIFARFNVDHLLQKVWFTRGVKSVVTFNDSPARIDDSLIDLIKSRVNEDGFVKLGEDFSQGDKVLIKAGPLKSIVGIFERDLKDSDRVTILLANISFQGRVTVEKSMVAKVS
jgi:transcriptional antiterminator RfaH